MSENRTFLKYKAHEIRGELMSDGTKSKSNQKRRLCLKKIVANLTMGNYHEMGQLFPDVIQIWRTDSDLEAKRMCHQYFCTLGSSKSDQISVALPVILDDLRSGSEELCLIALRTLVSINDPGHINEAFQHVKKLIMSGSKISSPLKKAAIHALVKLDIVDHKQVMELYEFLTDILDYGRDEPTVLVAALVALNEIHKHNPDMNRLNVTHNMCFNLLEILGKVNEWDIATIFDVLTTAYVPKTYSEAHHIIDMSVPNLQNVNASVVMNALKFIFYVANYVDYIEERLIRKFSSSIVCLLYTSRCV